MNFIWSIGYRIAFGISAEYKPQWYLTIWFGPLVLAWFELSEREGE